MKKLSLLLTCFISIQCMSQDIWTQKADFGGAQRLYSASFSIGTKAYVGTGQNAAYLKDFWEYDPSADTWTQKADFGGTIRAGATGLSIGSKGYIEGGQFFNTFYKELWQYDPTANTWIQKADFPGAGRPVAVGFSIGAKGYVGTGYKQSGFFYKDFYEYDPSSDTWTQKADYGGVGVLGAVGFSIGARGYIGTGYDGDSDYKDFWEFDPITNIWTKKADFGGSARSGGVGFGIGTKGYLGTGGNKKDFYEYDPALDTWTKKADFGGTGRSGATGFSIGSRGYIATGNSAATNVLWEYATLSVLPVTLSGIKAYQKDGGVQIEWIVQQENNISRYEVERSRNGQQFSTLKSIPLNGNSSLILNYNLFDPHPFRGLNFYRIKIIDKSTQVTFSQVLKVNTGRGAAGITVYPNPLTGNTIVLQIDNLEKGSYTINLTNKTGEQLIKRVINHAGGSASQTIEASKAFAAGVYQLTLTGEGIKITRQVIKK